MTHDAGRPSRQGLRSAQGFSILEVLVVVGIISVLAMIAIGITGEVVKNSKAESSAQQIVSFLRRHKELAVSRRRNIEIDFSGPTNRMRTFQRAVPNPPAATPAPTLLETMFFEADMHYRKFSALPDTPDLFGNAVAVNLGGPTPVIFTSEGQFVDNDGNPINATILLGVANETNSANAITIIGATGAIRTFHWTGGAWVK
jgi:prepilin-type N-terminal cleavage/methylation domain-containing protein